ncbi:MAG: hypothetical protein IPF99_15490 [Deltaproteobacteria bacterium]|nr:hypothetical protein [Deltaproteobacteria bacterium]
MVEAPVVADDRKRFTGGRRGPDLLSDLFDSVMELSFQHSAPEACSFVAGVITQNLRCDAKAISATTSTVTSSWHGEANTGRACWSIGCAKVTLLGRHALQAGREPRRSDGRRPRR